MTPFEPFALSTFCDDIRYEVNGKHSLIGIYRDDIILGTNSFPSTLPKLAVSVMLIDHPSQSMFDMDVKISFPGDPENQPQFTARIEARAEAIPDAPADKRRIINFHFILAPVTFKEPGHIKVRLHREGRIIKAGTLIVRTVDAQKQPLDALTGTPAPAGLLT